MILEKLLFNILAVGLFTIIFLKLIRKNSTSYISILIIQFLGFILNFIELLTNRNYGYTIKIVMYIWN